MLRNSSSVLLDCSLPILYECEFMFFLIFSILFIKKSLKSCASCLGDESEGSAETSLPFNRCFVILNNSLESLPHEFTFSE